MQDQTVSSDSGPEFVSESPAPYLSYGSQATHKSFSFT